MNTDIVPRPIDVPQSDLDDLAERLRRTRWPHQVPGAGYERGVPVADARELAARWLAEHDWRSWEKRVNALGPSSTVIDDQEIHFLHVRSERPDALPLILLHGWPGSVLEFLDVVTPLTEAGHHLVIPSHPNFGFSGPAAAGWDSLRIARAYAELMARLGYQRYGAQGGDFGAFIAPDLGRADPDHVVAVHVNAATAGFIPYGGVPEDVELTPAEQARAERLNRFQDDGNGYFQISATRPHTLGFGLSDSPAAQLTWILEKFHDWAHPAGSIPADAILAHATLYWLTGTGASSAQIYYESMHSGNWPTPSTTPTGVANFAEDVAIRQFAEQLNTIVHWADHDRGGHFAALEVPDLYVAEVTGFFEAYR